MNKPELPTNWAYKLKQRDLKLAGQWRKEHITSKGLEDYPRNPDTGKFLVSNWYDDSLYTASTNAIHERGYTLLTDIDFYSYVINPWLINKGKDPVFLDSLLSNPKSVTTIDIGARVVRGKDWKWDDQDRGRMGTIIRDSINNWVEVDWDYEDVSMFGYRIGEDDEYDLYYAESNLNSSNIVKPSVINSSNGILLNSILNRKNGKL
jgi:hypothetical protein